MYLCIPIFIQFPPRTFFYESHSVIFLTFRGQARYVRLGAINIMNISLNDVPPQDFNIKRFISHPDYRAPPKYHDIALVELDGSVKRTKYANIACLDLERIHTDNKLFIAGWGQTEFVGSSLGYLLQARVTITVNQKCNLYYKDEVKLPNGIVDDWMICAGGESDTCNVSINVLMQILASKMNYFNTFKLVTLFK